MTVTFGILIDSSPQKTSGKMPTYHITDHQKDRGKCKGGIILASSPFPFSLYML